MIKRGRREGWLREPVDALPNWARFHGVALNHVRIGPLPGFENRGSTVITNQDLTAGDGPLIIVPKDLIISKQNVQLLAKSDRHLREVIEAVGEFGRTTRGAVLIFLLLQTTICCPYCEDIGVLNPLTDYVKFLPDELLPIFWSEEEQELLSGTTLRPAVRAKLNSLLREFELVRTATESISWCNQYWWDAETGIVTFDDWMRIDAMYRSRALELPGAGDCMMPCIDMANHASGEATAARYETDGDGNGLLLLRDNKQIGVNGEITITYGDEKGACESIFSYGFLEDTGSASSAKIMFLDLDIPDDDPLRPAKLFVSNVAPGFRLCERDGDIEWESDFIWLVVVNEEDGLDFKVRQTIDGQRDVQAFWKEAEIDSLTLRQYIEQDPRRDIFELRAVVLLQQRVEVQNETLQTQGIERTASIRDGPWELAQRLRELEFGMLERAALVLEKQKMKLFDSQTVQQYLGLAIKAEDEEDDFT